MSQQKWRYIRPGNNFPNFGEPVWILASVSCYWPTGLEPGLFFCCCSPSALRFNVFRDALLQKSVVTSSYLTISSNQSGFSPLTSGIKAFLPTELPLNEYLLFSWPFSVNPRDGCVWKFQISSFWNTQTSPSGTNNHATFKVS